MLSLRWFVSGVRQSARIDVRKLQCMQSIGFLIIADAGTAGRGHGRARSDMPSAAGIRHMYTSFPSICCMLSAKKSKFLKYGVPNFRAGKFRGQIL